jgi:hypothetical protein
MLILLYLHVEEHHPLLDVPALSYSQISLSDCRSNFQFTQPSFFQAANFWAVIILYSRVFVAENLLRVGRDIHTGSSKPTIGPTPRSYASRGWTTDLYNLKDLMGIIIPGHSVYYKIITCLQSVFQWFTGQLNAENRLFMSISGSAPSARRQFQHAPTGRSACVHHH